MRIRPKNTKSPVRSLCRAFCYLPIRVREVKKHHTATTFLVGWGAKKEERLLYHNKRSSMANNSNFDTNAPRGAGRGAFYGRGALQA